MTVKDKIVFTFDGEELALDIDAVDTVVESDRFFLIPHGPAFLKGLISLNSEAIAVLDLPLLLLKEKVDLPPPHRLVVVRLENAALALYIGTAPLSFLWKESIEQGRWKEEAGEYSVGTFQVGKREVRVVDVAALMSLIERSIAARQGGKGAGDTLTTR